MNGKRPTLFHILSTDAVVSVDGFIGNIRIRVVTSVDHNLHAENRTAALEEFVCLYLDGTKALGSKTRDRIDSAALKDNCLAINRVRIARERARRLFLANFDKAREHRRKERAALGIECVGKVERRFITEHAEALVEMEADWGHQFLIQSNVTFTEGFSEFLFW